MKSPLSSESVILHVIVVPSSTETESEVSVAKEAIVKFAEAT